MRARTSPERPEFSLGPVPRPRTSPERQDLYRTEGDTGKVARMLSRAEIRTQLPRTTRRLLFVGPSTPKLAGRFGPSPHPDRFWGDRGAVRHRVSPKRGDTCMVVHFMPLTDCYLPTCPPSSISAGALRFRYGFRPTGSVPEWDIFEGRNMRLAHFTTYAA
jgi:hypothetical protein